MTAALCLALEGVILLTLSFDLAQGFGFLPAAGRIVLLVLAGAGLVPLSPRWRGARSTGPLLPAAVTVAAAALLLGLVGAAQGALTRRLEARWDAGARERLEARALLLKGDWTWLLDQVRDPLLKMRAPIADASEGFRLLERARRQSDLPPDRLGFAIYDTDGSLLAWDGNSADLPRGLLEGAAPEPALRLTGGPGAPRLCVIAATGDGRRVWVGEFLLRPPGIAAPASEPEPALEFLPHWAAIAPAHLHFRDDRRGTDDLTRFFQKHGDRHWGRSRDGSATLSYPLQGPAGEVLGIASLKDGRAVQQAARARGAARQTGAVATAALLLFAWGLLAVRGRLPAPALPRLVFGSVALWSIRVLLLLGGSATDLPGGRLYDITLYSSSGLLGMMRSPADLLLTAIAGLAQAWLIAACLRGLRVDGADRRRRLRRGAVALLLLLVAAGVPALHGFLDQMALDARLDVSRLPIDALLVPRLALQASLFMLVSAWILLLASLVRLALRCGPPPGSWTARLLLTRLTSADRIPAVLRGVVIVLALTLLYVPFLHHAYDRLRQTFFEDDLAPRVLHQKERRRQILRESLAAAVEPHFAAAAPVGEADEDEAGGSAAFRLWSSLPLSDMGLASSLQIFHEGGRPVSRFAVNLAPMLEIPFATAAEAATGEIHEVPPRPGATVKKTVIFGAEWLRPARRPPLLLVLAVVDHYDNLPMLGAETPYLQLFRARGLQRTNPELLRSDPMVAVFGEDLTRLYESGGEIPPPLPRARAELAAGRMAWVNDDVGDTPARILYFQGAGVIYALAQPHSGRLALLADYLRIFLLNLALAGLVMGGLRLARRAARRAAPRRAPESTFYGRLVTAVLITSLLPLLALASFFTQFSTREFERELTASGLSSLQVVRRVAEDYLTVSGPEQDAALDDDVVFWLSRVVRQDINIYGQRAIVATSTRELYSSGLLNQRLNGSVYRALYLEREPFVLTEERVGGLEHLSISAPMRIDREAADGVISIPLAAHRRAVGRKVEEVEDAILISTCLTVLLLAAVGYAIARRVSEPVVQLARAARRVAEGDLDVRVTAAARDETAILVEAFNRMAASLREQREDLRHRKEYIEKILSSATTGVVSIDARGSIITINPAAQALLGSPGGPPAPGADLQETLDREAYLRPLGDSLRRSLAGRTDTEAELVLNRGDSERRLRAVFIRFSPDEGAAPGRIILLEDVTEIVRSGRLAAWAEMARRIAHEIKNPLTPIQLSVEHVRRIWRAGDERFGTVLKDCLDNIQAQVRVLRQIASEFSAYARLPRLRAEPTAVTDLIDDALGPYATAAPPGVTLRRDVPGGLPAVLVDRAIMARALVNLIENALQAMPSGGTLAVAAAGHDGPEGGRRVRIEVTDTGVGIEPAALPRLFEPYFSTKSGGTGLGLAIARRAVEDHGGTIDIRSRPGEGTTVILILPATAGAP